MIAPHGGARRRQRPDPGRAPVRLLTSLALLTLGAGVAAVLWSSVRVPSGELALILGGDHPGRVVRGPAWTFHDPLATRVLRLSSGAREAEDAAVGIRLRARPDAGASAERLAAIAPDPSGSLREALGRGVAAAGPEPSPDALRSAVEDALRAAAWLPDSLEVQPPQRTVRTEDTGLNILVVGIDAGDWDWIDPLIAAGELPNLARLRATGAWATLHSDVPSLSPLLWTTAATGRPPDEHGIIDFVMVEPESGAQVPISSTFRKTKAFWNILSERGLSVSVVGWWATWPAEPVEGVLVSDRMAYSLFRYQEGEGSGGTVYPDSYFSRAASLKVEPWEISAEDLAPFARVTPEEIRASTARLRQEAGGPFEDHLDSLRRTLAATFTYHRIALDLLSRGQPRLAAVYYQGLDEVNHRFAHLTDPPHPLATEAERRRYGGAIRAFYLLQDRLLGELLDAVEPETTVMVLSDHGFANRLERPRDFPPYVEAGRPGRWHTLDGIWILAGPEVRPGRLQEPVTLERITPTLLRLLGLPLADDMPGKPVDAALDPAFLEALPDLRIASYEEAGSALPDGRPATSAVDDEVLARLRALGYLAAPGESEATPPGEGGTTSTYHANLGVIRLGRGDLEGAREAFDEALERYPGNLTARGGRIQIDMMEGRLEEALDGTLRLLDETTGFDPVFYYIAAQLYARTGRAEEGLAAFRGLVRSRPDVSFIHTGLGILHQALGDARQAAAAYREALDLKPDALYALQELFALESAGDPTALLARIDAAIRLSAAPVMPYNWRGLVLRRLGRDAEAEDSFRRALEEDPDSVRTLVNLSALLVEDRREEEAIPLLRRAVGIDPTALEPRVNLIVALGRTGRLQEAWTEYDEAGGAELESPPLLNGMALACYLNREPAAARQLLEQSLSLDPEQPDARKLLARLDGGS